MHYCPRDSLVNDLPIRPITVAEAGDPSAAVPLDGERPGHPVDGLQSQAEPHRGHHKQPIEAKVRRDAVAAIIVLTAGHPRPRPEGTEPQIAGGLQAGEANQEDELAADLCR